MININHITWLLDLQKATNVAYFGEEWKARWTPVAAQNSVYREWAEFLDEVTVDWKFYGDGIHMHHDAAVYEMVDVVHFMLSVILAGYGSALPVEFQLDVWKETQVEIEKVDLEQVTTSFTRFMRDSSMRTFSLFLADACGYLDLDIDTYMLAHKRKNDRNRLRAAGGADYDKSAETPLTLEF